MKIKARLAELATLLTDLVVRPVRSLDDLVFDLVFDPLARMLQDRASPSELAKTSISGVLVCLLVHLLVQYHAGSLSAIVAVEGGLVMAGLMFCYGFTATLAGRGARNPLRLSPFYTLWRVFSVVWIVPHDAMLLLGGVDATSLLNMASAVLGVCWFYFEACDRPPPQRRRESAWSRLATVPSRG